MRNFKVSSNRLRKNQLRFGVPPVRDRKLSSLDFLEAGEGLLAQPEEPQTFFLNWACLLIEFSLPGSLHLIIQLGDKPEKAIGLPEKLPLSFLINQRPYRGSLVRDEAKLEISLSLATQPEGAVKNLTDLSELLGPQNKLQLTWPQILVSPVPPTEVRRTLLLAVNILARYLEKKSLEKQLEQMRQLEERRLSLLREADHDLRGPFASLLVAADLLIERGLDLPATELSRLLHRLRHNANLLNRLLENYLSIPQLTAEGLNQPPNLQPLAFLPRLYSLVELVSPQLEHKSQTLEIEPAPLSATALPPVLADARFFDQIVLNLLYNAHRHTPPGTRLRLKITLEEAYLGLAVIDNGPGVAAHVLPRLRKLFDGEASSKLTKTNLPGLGLKLIYDLTLKQQGQAGFESSTAGATFWIKLPIVKT